MRATLSLVRREFSAYFLSPIAYVVLAVFLAVTGQLFYLTLEQLTARGPRGISYPMQLMVNDISFWLVFLFIPPLLTMRLFAEERGTGTLEMLLTAPLRDWQIVAAKFVACYAFYFLMWLPTLLYLPILLNWQVHWERFSIDGVQGLFFSSGLSGWLLLGATGALVLALLLALIPVSRLRVIALFLFLAGVVALIAGVCLSLNSSSDSLITLGVDPWPVVTSYLGLALAGAMFLALGLFISSLVKSQMVAALIALFAGLIFIMAGFWRPDMDTSSDLYKVLFFFTVPLHFERNFSRGLIDTRQLVLYSTVALFCLFLTIRSLESRRWR